MVCWGAPLLAIIIRVAIFRRFPTRSTALSVVFYIIVACAWLASGEGAVSGIVLLATLVLGPSLAAVILATGRRRTVDPEPHGFPILTKHDNDMQSN